MTETTNTSLADIAYDPYLDHAVNLTLAMLKDHGPATTPDQIPGILKTLYAAVRDASTPTEPPPAEEVRKLTPEEIKASITPDALISFENGRPYKALKRHLTALGLTPDQYRAKWGLPADYSMITASYSARRSALAKKNGLGRK